MSNAEKMVMVPREPTREMLEAYERHSLAPIGPLSKSGYEAMLDASPAQQHQGQPVALPDRKLINAAAQDKTLAYCQAWNACLDEIAKLGPLYTQADPGEVERLREGISKHWKVVCDQRAELDKLRAQLAERDALLSHREEILAKVAAGWPLRIYTKDDPLLIKTCGQVMCYSVDGGMMTTFDPDQMVLSASAEPSAPECGHAACKSLGEPHPFCQFVKGLEQAEPSAPTVHPINMKTIMQAFEQVDHKALLHGTSNWCAAMASALRGVLHEEPSALVEIDEWAEFEKAASALRVDGVGFDLSKTDRGVHLNLETRMLHAGWMARAALERKS